MAAALPDEVGAVFEHFRTAEMSTFAKGGGLGRRAAGYCGVPWDHAVGRGGIRGLRLLNRRLRRARLEPSTFRRRKNAAHPFTR
jgi:hypothetical protein